MANRVSRLMYKEKMGEEFPTGSEGTADGSCKGGIPFLGQSACKSYTAAMNDIPCATGALQSMYRSMVFGNMGNTSGTGVAFTRNPATGAKGIYG